MTHNPYIPILFLMAFGLGFAVFSIAMSAVVGPKRYNRAKLDAYECGIQPSPHAVGGGRFPVKYYLVAMIYIIFDVEVMFLYPWAVSFRELGMIGLVEMMLFLVTLTIPFVYVWKRGGLEWD